MIAESQRQKLKDILDNDSTRIRYNANEVLYMLLFPIQRELMDNAARTNQIPNEMPAPWEFWGEETYQKAIQHIAMRIHTGKFAMDLAWNSTLSACFNYNANFSDGKFFMDPEYHATYWDFMQQMRSRALFPHKISEAIRKGAISESDLEFYNEARMYLKMRTVGNPKQLQAEAEGIPMDFRIAVRKRIPNDRQRYVLYVIQSMKTLRSFLLKFGHRNQIIYTHLMRGAKSGLVYNGTRLSLGNFMPMIMEKGAERIEITEDATIDDMSKMFCYDLFRTTIAFNTLPTEDAQEMEAIISSAFAINQMDPRVVKFEFKKTKRRYRMHHIDYAMKAFPSSPQDITVGTATNQNIPGLIIEAHVGSGLDHIIGEFHPKYAHALVKEPRRAEELREHEVRPITRDTLGGYFVNFVTGPKRSMLTDIDDAIKSM